MVGIPMPRPSDTSPSDPGILDDVLEWGQGALNLFFDFKGRQSQSDVANSLARAEEAKLQQLQALQQGGAATPGGAPAYGGGLTSLPSWVVPAVLAAGVGLIAIVALKK